jgi:2-phosphosulfolactate phosphatase
MRWHIIEGEEGCRFAREHGCVAVVVDALRASATAAMLLATGAVEILAVRSVAEAFAAKKAWPDALLFGERGGLPPEGFDYGNSPQDVAAAAGSRVIFTTTTGAGRLISCWGAHAIYMGCPLNARAVARSAAAHQLDVVVIPAGLAGDPTFNAQEDWSGAAAILNEHPAAVLGEGCARITEWQQHIQAKGLLELVETAPHAEKLRRVGLTSDISYCAGLNTTSCVPWVSGRHRLGVYLARADGGASEKQLRKRI